MLNRIKVLLTCCCLLLPAAPGLAAALSPPAHQALSSAQSLIEQNKWREADLALEEVAGHFAAEPLAVATARQLQGVVRYERGQLESAFKAFEAALAHEELPVESRRQLLYNNAQLLLELERPQEAVERVEAWLVLVAATGTALEPAQRVRAAWIYLAAEHYRAAIEHLLAAIDEADKPEELWYRLLIQAGQGAEAWPELRSWLNEIVGRYPAGKLYWQQLAAVNIQLGDEAAAAAALRGAYHNGLLDRPDEILYLVRLLLYNKVPGSAAAIMEEAVAAGRVPATVANYRLLADAWQLAREPAKAVAALQLALAKEKTPEVGLTLGRLLLHGEHWQAAVAPLELAAGSDQAEIRGEALLALGLAHYQRGEYGLARGVFEQARLLSTSRRQADNWLRHLESAQQ